MFKKVFVSCAVLVAGMLSISAIAASGVSTPSRLQTHSFEGFQIGIPETFKRRETNTKVGAWLTPVVIFYGSSDKLGNENRIYVQGAGPFAIRAMDSEATCRRYTESFVRNNPPHWTTTLLEVKVDAYSRAFNRCFFRYVTKRATHSLIYEHFVYLPPAETSSPAQFDVFMYYYDGTAGDEIAAMRDSIRSFQIK